MGLQLPSCAISGITDLRRFDVPMTTLFPDADLAAFRDQRPSWLSEEAVSDDIVHLVIRSWLIRAGGRNILVDTCVGADKERHHWPDWHRQDGAIWTTALHAEGLTPEDIDIVFCTHLHSDHVGWNTKLLDGRWVPTFPNAKYLVGRDELEPWLNGTAGEDRHGSFTDSVLPILDHGMLESVDDGFDLATGITLKGMPGHTPGHMGVQITLGDGALLCGDAIHSPVQLAFPQWSSAFCSDPDQSRATRRALLEEVTETKSWLIPAHFQDPGFIKLQRDGAAYRPALL